MKRTARNSVLSALFCALSAHAAGVIMPGSQAEAPAPGQAAPTPAQLAPARSATAPAAAAAPVAPSGPSAESLVQEAAKIEKSDGCEAAYNKYKEANDRLSSVKDAGRRGQLAGIITNKMDKLQTCFASCQPNDKQRELFATAKDAAESEPHRASRILKQLLVGRSVDRCLFWSDARTLLRTMPGQAEQLDSDQADPCAMSADLQKAMNDARDAVKKERSEVADLNYDRSKLNGKVGELADLYRSMDATRMLLVELREGFIECDSVSKQLTADSQSLKESIGLAQDLVVGTYKEQLAAMGKKVRAAQAELSQKDELLTAQIGEEEKLKKQLEGISGLTEEIYNDLFSLAQTESVSFSVEVEGRKVEQPIEDVRALVQNEKQVIEKLSSKYPEFFKDGVNVEGLKRKKLVLEKVAQMMKRYGARSDQRLGYGRAVAELDATIQMMDRATAGIPEKTASIGGEPEKEGGSSLPILVGGGSVLAVAGLTFLRLRASGKN